MKQNQNKLKERREALNLTQKEVADRVGIAVQVYQRYEYGERLPQVDVALRINNSSTVVFKARARRIAISTGGVR